MGIPVWTDDFYHPGVVIEDGLNRLGEDFTYVYDANAIDPAVLDETPVLVLAKSNVRDQAHRTPYMTEALANRLVRFVREGGGLLVLHSGTTTYEEFPAIKALIGGVFVTHPEPLPVTCRLTAGHPLATGAADCTFVDEHYQMDVNGDIEVFMHTVSDHGAQPGGWLRHEGKGRVCVLTPGHFPPVFEDPNFQQLLRNALAFCRGTLQA